MAEEGSSIPAAKPPKGGQKAVAESRQVAAESQKGPITRGLWRCSVVTKKNITTLQDAGYLPSSEVTLARSPITKGLAGPYSIRVPQPHAGERVIFISHLLLGYMSRPNTTHPKAMVTIIMLVFWVFWNEKNVRVFRKKLLPPFCILKLIKDGAKL